MPLDFWKLNSISRSPLLRSYVTPFELRTPDWLSSKLSVPVPFVSLRMKPTYANRSPPTVSLAT